MTEEQLVKLCSKHGQVSSCQIKRTPERQSLGKALVTFANKEDALRAERSLYFEDLLGTNINIEFFQHDLKLQSIHKQEQNNEYVK